MSEKATATAAPEKTSRRSPRTKAVEMLPRIPSSNPFIGLQQAIGNQAMLHLLRAGTLQAKLRVSQPGDADEVEADRIADHVMRVPKSSAVEELGASQTSREVQRKCACGGNCDKCKQERGQHLPLQLKHGSSAAISQTEVPLVVHDALSSQGEPLDAATRAFMEPRFGQDFSSVRLHTDPRADAGAAALNAHAFTMGEHVVIRGGESSTSTERRALLAHELAHIVQQRGGSGHPRIHRFAASETDRIAPKYSDMLAQVRQLIDAATRPGLIWDDLNFDYFVEIAGGKSASREMNRKLGSEQPTIKSQLLRRYLFTCRCGLIDMRHFIQLLYISNYFAGFTGFTQQDANRRATKMGREHEIQAESASRFGAEDTPSNALGALTNVGLAANPQPDAVFDAIKDTLDRCGPVDWTSLSKPSQDKIIKFYSETVHDPSPRTSADKVIPRNQEQTAVPAILDVSECAGKERSLPFRIDPDDPDRKTFAGRDFLAGSPGLKSGKDVKRFVNTQRPEIIRNLPLSEKVRLLTILLDPPVDDDDLAAAKIIYTNSTPDELKAEPHPS